MEFEQIVMARYAVKQFNDTKLTEEQVAKLLELIRHAPSSYNIQPWAIKIVSDAETKAKLAPAAWNQTQITSCSHLLVFCANTDIAGNIDKVEKMLTEKNLPTGAVPYMRAFEEGMTADHRKNWAQRQVYLALGNAVNGAKALGFDSCPMEGFTPEQFHTILNLPANIVPTALCAIGYAADTPRPKVRLDIKDIVL